MIKLELKGLDELQRKLEKLEKDFPEATHQGMIDAGFYAQKIAKRLVRVDTGRLRASISVNWTGSGLGNGAVEDKAKKSDGVKEPKDKGFTVVIGTRVEYAVYQELGTKKMSAQPYLRPGFFYALEKLPGFIKKRVSERG
jgi:HK97 gp10 family phage protein